MSVSMLSCPGLLSSGARLGLEPVTYKSRPSAYRLHLHATQKTKNLSVIIYTS